jgi:hypothetical protein
MELLDDFLRGDEVDDWDESSLYDKPVRIFYFYTDANNSIQKDLEILRSRHLVNGIVLKNNPESIDNAVRDAVRIAERPGISAVMSRSVSKRYPLERRRRELLLLIENIA